MYKNPEIYFVTIIGIILGLLLVGFIVAILFLYQRRQQQQEQEMEKLKAEYEKEALLSQLEMQENTFKTISQELHDNIGQILSVVKLTLSALPIEKEHKAYESLQSSQQFLFKAIEDLSNLTKSLHTDRITQLGLVESVRTDLDSVRRTGIVSINFNKTGTELPFDEQRAIFIFRIFQEVLNNILKHAQATEVNVNLEYLNNKFVLEIKDNGIGFDVAEKRKSAQSGLGLKSLFNRAQLIGAVITIKSEPNNGTKVLLEIPLNKEQ